MLIYKRRQRQRRAGPVVSRFCVKLNTQLNLGKKHSIGIAQATTTAIKIGARSYVCVCVCVGYIDILILRIIYAHTHTHTLTHSVSQINM